MSSSLMLLVLFSVTGMLFMLPLLPAIFELQRKRDATPLSVVQQHAGEIRHFAGGFRKCIDVLQESLNQCVASSTNGSSTLADGETCILLGRDDAAVAESEMRGPICRSVIAAGVNLSPASGLTFLKEVYAGGQFRGGERTTYRAILGNKSIYIGRGSKVTRWAHASDNFQIDHGCELYGRVSCDRDMSLQSGCGFQRLNAPRIVLGDETSAPDSSGDPFSEASGPTPLEQPRQRKLIEGDWEIMPGEIVTENIVTRGKLHIGTGAKIFGSVKSNGELTVEPGVTLAGSLIGAATIHIGGGCKIRGPVIAEYRMTIESGSQCGAAEAPTTVSAPMIDVEEGSLFFGTLWAREHGRVIPKQ
jgi:predicted acyltransferase (DUF342 family)